MMLRLSALVMTWAMTAGAALAARNTSDATEVIKRGTESLHSLSRLIVYGTGGLGILLVAVAIFKMATEDDDDDRWRASVALMIGSGFTIFAVILGAVTRVFLA